MASTSMCSTQRRSCWAGRACVYVLQCEKHRNETHWRHPVRHLRRPRLRVVRLQLVRFPSSRISHFRFSPPIEYSISYTPFSQVPCLAIALSGLTFWVVPCWRVEITPPWVKKAELRARREEFVRSRSCFVSPPTISPVRRRRCPENPCSPYGSRGPNESFFLSSLRLS